MKAIQNRAPQFMAAKHTTSRTIHAASHHLRRNLATEPMPPHPGINPGGIPPMAAMAIHRQTGVRLTIKRRSRDHRRTISMLQYPLHGLMPPAISAQMGRRTRTSTTPCRHFCVTRTSTLSRSARFDENSRSTSVWTCLRGRLPSTPR